MEGFAGQGERPDYLEPKYKTMADQAKAYKDLQKAFGALSGAPEQYDVTPFLQSIDVENPNIKDYMSWARENRISQDAFNKTVETFIAYDKSKQIDLNAEKSKLGPNADQRIETVKNWLENNFSQKTLDAWSSVSNKAEVIEFLDELRQYDYHQSSQPPAPQGIDSSQFKPLTVEEVRTEMQTNYKKYRDDANYRDEINRKFKQAMGE